MWFFLSKAVEQYFIVMLFVFQFSPVCNSGMENLLVLDLAVSGVKELSIPRGVYRVQLFHARDFPLLIPCHPSLADIYLCLIV